MLQRWLSVRACQLHAALLVIVPGCLIAGWWQLHQALHGNSLSWAYTFEWPAFAIIASVAWWHLLHEAPEQRAARLAPAVAAASDPDEADSPTSDDAPVVDDALRRRVAEAARLEYERHLQRQAEDVPAPGLRPADTASRRG